ncbi:MAG: Nif3-like dinuclear metal center hexameric protein [Kiritimatiellae bacterium]|nr:Nif3-like dinuclear metal center hexameric protein [Kiritimatiellia bacterium]
MPAVPLRSLVRALDEELHLADFAGDPSNNGLQVDGAPDGVSKVCCGVDASPAFIAEAVRRGAQFAFVHHGISWGSSLARIAGPNYRLVAPLVRSGLALYAAHLPLDAHPRLGNNAGLARAIGLEDLEPFAEWRGSTIGVKGRFPEPVPLAELHRRVREACPGGRFEHVDAGAALVRSAGVVSGGAAEDFPQAVAAGLDAYVTGEIGLADYNAVLNDPIDFVAAGHYATERFGPRAVAGWIAKTFGIEAEFVDFGLPF